MRTLRLQAVRHTVQPASVWSKMLIARPQKMLISGNERREKTCE